MDEETVNDAVLAGADNVARSRGWDGGAVLVSFALDEAVPFSWNLGTVFALVGSFV